MTHFLYRPHIVGPENDITTPDILIDRVTLQSNGEEHFIPVHRLSSHIELQVAEYDLLITPAYAVVASGGGALLSLAAVIQAVDQPLAMSDVIIARSAWRLRNVISHFDSLQLSVEIGPNAGSANLADLPQPSESMRRSESGELEMPRGVVGLFAAQHAALAASAPAKGILQFSDDVLSRRLSHTFDLIPVSTDRWNERPLPRYTVGPVGDVQHYI